MTTKKLILVVDDERDLADLLVYNLKRAGYDTAVAYTGRQALDAVAARKPDLILLDVMLPELAGHRSRGAGAFEPQHRGDPHRHAHRQGRRDRSDRGPDCRRR